MTTLKSYLSWPWFVSVPLLLTGFGFSVFFIGTDSPYFSPAIFALMAFAGIAVAPNIKNGWAIPCTNTVIFIMLFWGWMVLNLVWATTPYISGLFTSIVSILPAIFMVSILSPRAGEWVKVHAFAVWLGIGVFALWALVQFFFLFDQYGPRIHHPLLDPNSLAGLLNMGVLPALGLFLVARKPSHVVLSGIALVLYYAALVVTQSRAGFMSCAVSALVLLPFTFWRNKDNIPWKKLAVIAAIAFLVPLLSNFSGALEKNLIGETLKNYRSLEDRFFLWHSTLRMAMDHFWVGTGLASFFFYYPLYRDPLDRSDGFFAHMDPLQFWAEMGILAPVFFYAALICILLRTARAVKTSTEVNSRIAIMAPFAGMLALTGHAHMNYHLYMPGLLLPLSLLLAYWYVATEKALGDAGARIVFRPQGRRRLAVGAGFVIVALVVGGWIARGTVATYLITEVQKQSTGGQMDKALKTLHLAGIIAPGSFGRYYEYEARMRLARLWENAKTMDRAEARKLYDEALENLHKARALNPAFTTIWDLEARLHYAVQGVLLVDGVDLAIKGLKEVVKANPLAADARVGLANIYKAQGDIATAAKTLEDGVQWPRPKGRPDITFIVTLAQLKKELGDEKAYEFYMAEAKKRAAAYNMTLK